MRARIDILGEYTDRIQENEGVRGMGFGSDPVYVVDKLTDTELLGRIKRIIYRVIVDIPSTGNIGAGSVCFSEHRTLEKAHRMLVRIANRTIVVREYPPKDIG